MLRHQDLGGGGGGGGIWASYWYIEAWELKEMRKLIHRLEP